MKKILNLLAATLVCLVLNQTTAMASSHREAPLISNDPLADNTDLYAFRSPVDTNKVVLIANYIPFEHPAGGPNWYTFGENIRYEIHVKNQSATNADDIVYRFTFKQTYEDSTTFFRIRLGKENWKTTYTLERSMNGGAFTAIVTNGIVPPPNIGPRSIENTTLGINSAANATYGGKAPNYDSVMFKSVMTASTGEKVFAGPVDDPFFVDLGGAFDLGGFRNPGRDGVAKFNVHSLVVEVPISTLQKNGKTTSQATSILDPNYIIGVYATASRAAVKVFDSTTGNVSVGGTYVQVSRLGMPLTNEVVIPIGQKDKWNSITTNTSDEDQFDQFIKNPEIALYMDTSKFGNAVPGLKALRIQSKSLGAYDFRNGRRGLFDLRKTNAGAGTALDTAAYGKYLLPDSVSPRAVDLLPIFKTGVPNLPPYQLATGKPSANPVLGVGKPFVNNFLPTFGDMLRLNMAVPVTPRTVNGSANPDFSTLGLVYAAVLGLTDSRYTASGTALQMIPNMDGFPNGRRLEDDVVTISLQAVSGVVLAAIGLWYDDYIPGTSPSPVTPQLQSVLGFNAGVTKNDTTLKSVFPYEQAPWRGFIGNSYVGPKSQDPLPVKFVDFTADKVGQQVLLRWSVANDVTNGRYSVEQSSDGARFNEIGSVVAASGASNSYQLLDKSPNLNKINYYRIKQVDADGRYVYTPIRAIKFVGKSDIIITPNPASNFIKVYSKLSPLTISLLDGNGKKLASQVVTNGSTQFNISSFPKGVYVIVADSDGERVDTRKIVKQ